MDYTILDEKQKRCLLHIKTVPDLAVQSFERAFELEFTHNSTAIEGNTLTLLETKAVIEDGLSIGGKDLREIYEVINHQKAYEYIKKCVAEQENLNEIIIKNIHEILMQNIMQGGIYRNQEVRISGATHTPPAGQKMYNQMQNFLYDLVEKQKNGTHPIELAAWTHAEFVRIHPFLDGNGRCSRLLMNYQLIANNFLPISIKKENRLTYYEALDNYASQKKLAPFIEMIATLEGARLDEYINM